jgi:ABC-type nitrate/sulfonate/bicarbonate transport system substrate-binding protein
MFRNKRHDNNRRRAPLGKAVALFCAASLSAAVLAACSSSSQASSSQSGTASANSQHLTPVAITLALNPPKMSLIGFYVAKYEGFFAQNGLNVSLMGESNGNQAAEGALTGVSQFSANGTDVLVSSAAAQPGSQVGVWTYAANDLALIGQSSVKNYSDLIGKSVGFGDLVNPGTQMFLLELKRNGIPKSDVHFAILSGYPALDAAMADGRISSSVFHVDDYYALSAKDPGLRIVDPFYSTVPQWWYDAVSTSQAFAQSHPQVVVALVKSMIEADEWMYTHGPQTIKLAVTYTQESPETVTEAYDYLSKAHIWQTGVGTTESDVMYTANQMYDEKQIGRVPSYSQLYDTTYVDQALSELGGK